MPFKFFNLVVQICLIYYLIIYIKFNSIHR